LVTAIDSEIDRLKQAQSLLAGIESRNGLKVQSAKPAVEENSL
jgi:hypothetical protein